MKNSKAVPYLIGIPNLGVGLLWAMNMTLIPMLVNTFDVTNREAGFLISMGAFTGIFVQYISGMLSDRSNFKMGKRKPFMLMGSIAASLSMCLMPFSNSYIMLFAFSFIFYFSLNFYQGPYYSLIPEVVDQKQLGLANGVSRFISVLGASLIFLTGSMLWDINLTVNINHSLPFFISAFLGIITVVVTVIFIKERPVNKIELSPKTTSCSIKFSSKIKDSFVKLPSTLKVFFLKFPSAMKLFAIVFFIYLGNGSVTPFFLKYCVNNLGISAEAAGNSLFVLTITGALCAPFIGFASDKIKRKNVMFFGTLLYTFALICGVFVKTILLLNIVMAVIGIGFITIQITSYALLAEVVPQERLGEFMGIFNFFVSISQFIATNLMGNLLDYMGYNIFFPAATLFLAIASIILYFSKIQNYNADTSNVIRM